MLARDLISNDLFPLKKTDTVEAAIMLMLDWKVFDLPVVDGGIILGNCEYSVLAEEKKSKPISHFIRNNKTIVVPINHHMFELVKIFSETGLSVIAAMNADNSFAGLVSGKSLFQAYRQSALAQPGGIITMQMPVRNYSLAEISRLVEYNDVKILHVFIKTLEEENDHIEISIKLNTPELKNIISTLERYQYNITGIHQASEIPDNFQSRFDYLVKYLNT